MSRQIKFRAWHAENKEMVNFNNEKLCTDEYQRLYLAMLMAGKYGDVLMQFTGLTDKNGVDVFEGDIIEISGKLMLVEHKLYTTGQTYGHGHSGECRYSGFKIDGYYGSPKTAKVVGNIYQNPELLEQVK